MGLIKKLLRRAHRSKKKRRRKMVEFVSKDHNNDYFFGWYVGEYMLKKIPNKSCDFLLGDYVIKVNKEDEEKHRTLDWESITYSTNSGMPQIIKEKHNKFVAFSRELDRKYLPNPLRLTLPYFEYDDEESFKKGICGALRDSDRCSYDIDNIKILPPRGYSRVIELRLPEG